MSHATEIAALETALASGVLTVTRNGRTTTYRSADEIKKAITYFRQRDRSTSRPGYKINKLVTSARD